MSANYNQPNRVCTGDGSGGFSACSDVSTDANRSEGVALTVSPTPPPPSACIPRTDYGPGICGSSTFNAASLADLAAYVASDFGKDGGDMFMNLRIIADLDATGANLVIQSPCRVGVVSNVQLTGNLVSIDGLERVIAGDYSIIDATTAACLLSPKGNALLGADTRITAAAATIEGGGKKALVGNNAILDISGTLVVNATAGVAAIGRDASVTVGGDMELTAIRGAKIADRTVVDVGGNLNMDAAAAVKKCKVSGSATITYATKSGNCAPRLP